MERHAELVYAESLFEKVRPSVYRLGLLPFVFPDMFLVLVLVLVLFLGYGFVLGPQVWRLNPNPNPNSEEGFEIRNGVVVVVFWMQPLRKAAGRGGENRKDHFS